jgi:hypothetical protein
MTIIIIVGLLCLPVYASAQFLFQDATAEAGIYMLGSGSGDAGSGVVVADFNVDGWDDLYLPGGFDSDKIFINLHDGTFMPVLPLNVATHLENNGLQFRLDPRGGVVFDYDNDGLPDIYVVCEGNDILWHNNGNFTFSNATDSAHILGTLSQNESMSATFGDFNGDGFNDLYVARWISEFGNDTANGILGYANKGFPNWLYVNNGNGTFTDRAKEFGVDGDTGCSNIAIFFDYDRDGDLDLLVGNDFGVEEMPNRVYKNMLMETGVATFVRVDSAIGLDQHLFCMAICPNDYNRDGYFDFYESTIGPDSLMRGNAEGTFTGVNKSALPAWQGFEKLGKFYITTNWTAIMGDFDNDGWEDAFVVHGTLGSRFSLTNDGRIENPTKHDTSIFYHNLYGVFDDFTDRAMNGNYIDLQGRGAGSLDYNHDGKIDLVIGSISASAADITSNFRLLKNVTAPSENSGHWLEMRFVAKRTAKEAIGTIVDVWSGGVLSTRQVSTGGGFGSQNSLMQHVGLGEDNFADSIIVYWPCDKNRFRQIDRYYHIKADTILTFTEGLLGAVLPSRTQKNPVILYPLPARDILTVSNLGSGLTTITIYNILGVKQMEEKTSGSVCSIPVSKLSPGCYLMSIAADGILDNKMFMKE